MQYLIIMLLFVPLVEFLSLYLPLLFTLLLQVISSYFIICIITRRLRDMNYSPRIIIILGTLLLCAVCFAVLGHSAITSFHEFYKIASLAIGIPTVISWVFLATILLFSVGDADDNKYGRVPVGLDFRPMVSDKAFFESKAEKSREFTDNKIDPLAPWRKDDGKNIENSAETKNSAEYSTERPSKGSPASRLFSFIFKFFLVSIGLYLSLAAAVAIYEWLVIST